MKRDTKKPKRDPEWRDDIQIAIDLCYPVEAIMLLEQEPNAAKRQGILTDARNGVYGER